MSCCYDHAYFRQGAGLNWGRAAVLPGLVCYVRGVLDRIDVKICVGAARVCMLFTYMGTSANGSIALMGHNELLLSKTGHTTSKFPQIFYSHLLYTADCGSSLRR